MTSEPTRYKIRIMMNAIPAESARTLSVSGFARYWQYRDLVRNLVVKDLKVRYQGAMLGFFWSLGNPLAGCGKTQQ